MDKVYTIAVVPETAENGGGFAAFVADLPGCMGHGETQEDALADARGAIGEWLDEAKAQGMAIPEPGSALQAVIAERKSLIQSLNQQRTALEAMNREVQQLQEQYNALLAVATESLTEPAMRQVTSVAIFANAVRLEHSVQ